MQKQLFSVYDSKAQVYGNPFTSINEQLAMRDFQQACRDTNSQLHHFPNDFALYLIGEFDDSVMMIHPTLPQPRHICNATHPME